MAREESRTCSPEFREKRSKLLKDFEVRNSDLSLLVCFGFSSFGFGILIRGASCGSTVRFDSRPEVRKGQAYHPEKSRRAAISPTLAKENRRQNRGIPNRDLSVGLLCRSSGRAAYWTKVQYTGFQFFARQTSACAILCVLGVPSCLAGKEFRRNVSRKGAKHVLSLAEGGAKFGEIKKGKKL